MLRKLNQWIYNRMYEYETYLDIIKSSNIRFPIGWNPFSKLSSFFKKVVINESLYIFFWRIMTVLLKIRSMHYFTYFKFCRLISCNQLKMNSRLVITCMKDLKLSRVWLGPCFNGLSTNVLLSLYILAIWTVCNKVPGPPMQ